MIALLLAVASAAADQPIALRVEAEGLGKGPTGTVVGVVLQVAPEERAGLGERVRVMLSYSVGTEVVDRGAAVVALAQDGTAMLYREWPVGEGTMRVIVDSLDGKRRGSWSGPFKVPHLEEPFEAPPDASPDAVALAATPPDAGGVSFIPPQRTGGIGALQLELRAPERTARVEFFQDGEPLVQKQRPPWTVSMNLGEVPRRTTVRGVAWAADGAFIGEDAIVFNGPSAEIPVEILLGPEPRDGGDRVVTVTAGGVSRLEEITLKLDDEPVARWLACPCVARIPAERLAAAKVMVAEARGPGGRRGEKVSVVEGAQFVEEVRVDQVELAVVVVDQAGRPVSGLERGDFTVLEDGSEMVLDGFGTTADLPLSLGLLVDTSGSMERSFDEVKNAVAAFARDLLRPGDAYFLSTFAFDANVELQWTEEAQRLAGALDRVTPQGGTALHDAVVRSLEMFRGRRGRTALVLLTDGDDTASRTGWDVALRFCRTVRTPVFPIGLRISALDFFVRARLKELAESTGGEAYFAGKGTDLNDVYRRIAEQLRAQYLLSYRSSSEKGRDELRTVKVLVKGEGLTARTIAGYYPGW